MTDKLFPFTDLDSPTNYKIKVKGHLTPEWTNWFDGIDITHNENNETILSGLVADQAALYGLLGKVRDLGMPLLSIENIKSNHENKLDRGK